MGFGINPDEFTKERLRGGKRDGSREKSVEMENVIVFILGVAAGIAWYKFYIMYTIERITHTVCDYCQFQKCKKEIKKEFSCQKKK